MNALKARWNTLPANSRGAFMVIAGSLVLVCMITLVKHMAQTMPVFQILFVRCLFGLLAMTPLFASRGLDLVRTKRPFMHFTRGAIGTLGNFCVFYAVAHMVLADAITIQFSRPLFMLFVAYFMFGEAVGWRQSGAAMVGFSGILLIARPFGGDFEPVVLVAVLGAFTATGVVTAVKILSRTEPTMVIMFYFALWTTILTFIPALFVWQTPSWTELALLALTGVLGIVGQGMFTHGVGLGETSFVMPFDYLRIVYSAIFGIVLFAEIPTWWSVAGAALIIGSGLYLLLTEKGKGSTPDEAV